MALIPKSANSLLKMNEAKLGIKNLCLENWMSPDPLMRDLVKLNKENGIVSVMSGDDWALQILEPKLIETVPIEILRLFEVARGSMLYGYFFYPLFTVAYEQLTRVAETAITEKCRQIGASKSANTFAKRVDYLRNANVLSEEENAQWDAFRMLRNIASHPDQQTILPPGVTLEFVFNTSQLINRLFVAMPNSVLNADALPHTG